MNVQGHIVDAFGASILWLSLGSLLLSFQLETPNVRCNGLSSELLSRCVLLGVSCGGNYVARKAVEAGKLLEPVKQLLHRF
ncbi:hypothetical protein F2Q69_00058120 [Brassica cretica]|uniref:Uncharacterized protein n=1 Tax=Brassica cretica TaxID=69181 RepID=A0A8S9RDG0_BRACR|nr:hypothetical protein F2Q69_00058120 [Brassica cretica]